MILRRLTEHVKAQNWFAVALDFIIVVSGVFLGLQVNNWNADRNAKTEYRLAHERLLVEARGNLDTLTVFETALDEQLASVTQAFDLLLACKDDPESEALIIFGLNGLSGSAGLDLRLSTLSEITKSESLLAQQSPAERERFGDLLAKLEFLESEARFAENLPLAERAENNPVIAVGPKMELQSTLLGTGFSRVVRPLVLAVPVSEACKNDALIKSFWTWDRWQSQQRVIAFDMREIVESMLEEAEPQ